MNSRLFSGWMVAACLLLGACKHESMLRASDYKQSCDKDTDCMTVLVGEPCKCSCEAASINHADMEQYSKDLADIRADCADEVVSCGKCPDLGASVCSDQKKCEAVVTPKK